MKKGLVAILICFSFVAKAQELTMIEAVEKALENNYDIKLIAGNYEVAKTQNSWGMAGMVPTF
ncbi:MAG: hypothetical protein BM555_04235, partial [Crocinitomix sp. MedPE-SWsnd]